MVKALAAGSAMASLQLADASEHLEQLVKARAMPLEGRRRFRWPHGRIILGVPSPFFPGILRRNGRLLKRTMVENGQSTSGFKIM